MKEWSYAGREPGREVHQCRLAFQSHLHCFNNNHNGHHRGEERASASFSWLQSISREVRARTQARENLKWKAWRLAACWLAQPGSCLLSLLSFLYTFKLYFEK
jgi:G:T-mismatch repair DNA endonuclease (very short patch repair protein)